MHMHSANVVGVGRVKYVRESINVNKVYMSK